MTPRNIRTAFATLALALAPLCVPAQPAPKTPPAPSPRPPRVEPIFLSPPAGAAAATDLPATPALVPAGNPDERISANWPAIPLSMAIPEIEKLTGRTILRPATLPNVADLTLTFATPPTRAEALQAIETLFTLNQLALIPRGEKFLMLVPLNTARSEAPTIIEGSTLDLPPSGRIASKLFQLEFLRVDEFVATITPMLNTQVQAISIFQRSNAILYTDTISTLQRIETIIKQIDRPASTPVQVKFYNLEYAKASDIVNKLKAIFVGPLQQQLGASTSFNADDRTNQIIVIGDPRQLSLFDDLMKKFDVKADPNTRNEVIRLKSANCTEVATLLSNVISAQTRAAQAAQAGGGSATATQRQAAQTTTRATTRTNTRTTQAAAQNRAAQQRTAAQQTGRSTTPAFASGGNFSAAGLDGNEFSTYVTVQADTRINAIVVSGTVDDIRIIKELIEKLDVLLAQVRIEVVIAEVTLSDDSQSGISTLGFNVENGKLTGILGAGPGFSFGSNADGSSYSASLQPLTAVIGLGTTPRKNNATIVSKPSITTMHNKAGKIFIGETRPVITASTVNTNNSNNATTSSITQLEIGTTITVTPLIGYDGSVQLTIEQEISDVTGEVSIDGNTQYIIGKRNTSSDIIVKSGEIIVLGGIEKNSASRTTNRLGPIPIIGDLFGRRSRSQARTEIIFFLRPVVLTNTAADNAPAMEQLERMSNKNEVQKILNQTVTPVGAEANALPALPEKTSRKKRKH